MAVNNIWVFAQVSNGAPTTGTLELLTKARSLGGTVSAFIPPTNSPSRSSNGRT